MEGAGQPARRHRGGGPAGDPREARCDHAERRYRRCQGVHPEPDGDPRRQCQPAAGARARRRLRLQSGRGRHCRSRADGRLWRLQSDLLRLPHAARPSLSRGHGRCHGGMEGRAHAAGSPQHGDLRHLDRRRHDARDDPAGQAGGPAAASRDRARYALGGPHRNRRHVQDQRMARQCAGELQRVSQPRRAPLRQRARSQGSADLADLRRLHRLPARHPDQRHARPVPEPHRAHAPQAAPRRRRGRAAGVRGHVARAVQFRPLRA